ncbi:hypothetical protein Tco_0447044, partial [Tanacetum coccineum]
YFTQGNVSNISIGGSINSEGFLSSILLSVVIIVTIVVVVLVVVVIAIVRVVIVVLFRIVVVVGGISSIFKLSFVIVDSFSCYWSSSKIDVLVGITNTCHGSSLCF